jgi:putative pyoverdin transport system ATP-binding/permease protein
MKIIRLLLKNSGKTFYLAAICSFISGASNSGVIAIINYALAHFPDLSAWLSWLFLVLCLVFSGFQAITLTLLARLSQEIIYNLRFQMAESILACPLQHLETIGQPKLLANLTEDITAIASATVRLSEMIVNLTLLLGIFIYFWWLSPWLFVSILVLIIASYIFYSWLERRGYQYFSLARQNQDNLYGNFRSITEGIKELKLNRSKRHAFLNQDLRTSATGAKIYFIKAMSIFSFTGSFGLVVFFLPIGLLLFVVPQFTELSVGVISGYTLAILYLILPMEGILNAMPEITKANVALENIESLKLSLSEKTIEPNFPTGSNFDDNWTSLELVDINHAYRGEKEEHQFTLDNINLQFKPGELVFIVGGNGSGKSTLIKLITGLYTPDRGQILLNNLTVQDDNREWYRQQFSVVFYDFYLFERLLGIEANRETEIQNYLNLLEIEHKVTVKDGNLSTTNLSQGQRKRLALLTAYLEDRPIYVFDEWASDQDPVFKEIFYKKLLPQLKNRGKTVIAVSHDDRYFTECDRIIKLDYGRIIEDRYLS